VSGLRYIPLLRSGDIIISEVNLEEPFFIFRNRKNGSTANNGKGDSLKKINIKKFNIQNGDLEVFREATDSLHLKVEDIDVLLTEVFVTEQTMTKDIPVTFASYRLDTEKGYYDLGPLEFIQWDNLHLDSEIGHIKKLMLRSKYAKKELSEKLTVEHDHYDLEID